MTYTIAEPCVDVMDQACVAVCPVDCIQFEEGVDRTLYIDPDECIDCGACEPECPVAAIYPEDSVPADQAKYTELNALWFQVRPSASPSSTRAWRSTTSSSVMLVCSRPGARLMPPPPRPTCWPRRRQPARRRGPVACGSSCAPASRPASTMGCRAMSNSRCCATSLATSRRAWSAGSICATSPSAPRDESHPRTGP